MRDERFEGIRGGNVGCNNTRMGCVFGSMEVLPCWGPDVLTDNSVTAMMLRGARWIAADEQSNRNSTSVRRTQSSLLD